MIFKLGVAGVALLGGWSVFGQTAIPLSFDVASVKPAVPGPWRESKVLMDRIDFPGVTLRYCLAFSNRVKEYQISGPAWLSEQKYDIVAKGPAGTTRDQLPAMMQALLAQRFKLQARTEKKDFNVFVLSVGKNGPKLKESPKDPAAEELGAKFGMSMGFSGVGRLEARNATMAALANTLARLVGGPVIDMTELTGRYDLDLEYSPGDGNAMRVATPPAGALPVAVESPASVFSSVLQFGLRLDSRTVALPAIVVESAERVPTEN